jgi:hypothetical protein
MATHAANQVVQIIHRDEENVRLCGFLLSASRHSLRAKSKDDK